MKPTFNLSAAEAPVAIPPASSSAAAAAKNVFLIVKLQQSGGTSVQPRRPIAHVRIRNHRSGTNTVPSAAGAVEPPVRARDIRTRTITVARYGSADMNCEGTPTPA